MISYSVRKWDDSHYVERFTSIEGAKRRCNALNWLYPAGGYYVF